MKDYVATRIRLNPWNEDMADYLAALLADIGYESFTQDAPLMTAYINKEQFSQEAVDKALEDYPDHDSLSNENEVVEGRDWNQEWEKNYFKPIVVGGRCVVRSSFHTDAPKAEYEIVVDPKMAFGTGHHSTTNLMLTWLLDNHIVGKSVTDMGTGTGILAIMAAMRGADSVCGVEIDPDAWKNAVENELLNKDSIVRLSPKGKNALLPDLRCGDASLLPDLPKADIFLANINRNIITADLPAYRQAMKRGAQFICSGFYLPDLEIIAAKAGECGMKLLGHAIDNGWVRAEFQVL